MLFYTRRVKPKKKKKSETKKRSCYERLKRGKICNITFLSLIGIREPNPIIWPRFARSDEVLSKDDFYLRSGRSVDYGKLHKMDLMLRIKKLIKLLSQVKEEDVPITPVKREKEKAEDEPSYVNYFKLRT